MSALRLERWTMGLLSLLGAAAILSVYLVGLSLPLSNYDEPLYAEFIRAMHSSGDYWSLRYQGALTLQRPATPVALYAVVARLAEGELGLRLAPALLTALAALLCGAVVARVFRDRCAAVFSVALVAAAPTTLTYGRLLLSDPPFVLAVVAAIWATMAAQRDPRWLIGAGAALGAALACKSLAGAVPLATLAPWMAAAALKHRRRRGGRHLLAALIALCALGLPYLALGLRAHGARFWNEHLGHMLLDRAAGTLSPLIGLGGPLAYLRQMWTVDGPVFTVVLLASMLGATAWAVRGRDRELGVASSCALGSLVLLSAMGTRLSHYLLSVYPAAAICAGGLAARLATRPSAQRPARLILTCAALALFAHGIARDRQDGATRPSLESRDLGLAARTEAAPGERVYSLDWYSPAFGYYAARPFTLLSSSAELASLLGACDPFRQAANVSAVPPWPGGEPLVAGPRAAFAASRLELSRVVTQSGSYVLARVRLRP